MIWWCTEKCPASTEELFRKICFLIAQEMLKPCNMYEHRFVPKSPAVTRHCLQTVAIPWVVWTIHSQYQAILWIALIQGMELSRYQFMTDLKGVNSIRTRSLQLPVYHGLMMRGGCWWYEAVKLADNIPLTLANAHMHLAYTTATKKNKVFYGYIKDNNVIFLF